MVEVSIVLPTYNRAKFLRRSITSVLCQSFADFELLVIDDASTDDTEQVVKDFCDPRVKYFRHSDNQGAAAARNTGLCNCLGKYVAFQDSDDEWPKEKLELQVEAMRRTDKSIGVIHTRFSRTRNGKLLAPTQVKRVMQGDLSKEILKGNMIATPTVLVRRECFEKVGVFDTALVQLEDWEMWIRIAQEYRFLYLSSTIVRTHELAERLSSDMHALIRAHLYILEKHRNLFSAQEEILASELYWIGNLLCRVGNMKAGRKYIAEALAMHPKHIKYTIALGLSCMGSTLYKVGSHLRNIFRNFGKTS